MVNLELTNEERDELEQLLLDVVYSNKKLPFRLNMSLLFDILTKVESLEKLKVDHLPPPEGHSTVQYLTRDQNASWNLPK